MVRRRLRLIAALMLVWLTIPTATAHAADPERIVEQQVTYTLQRNGTLHVVEVFDYDFGTNQRHGLERLYRTAELWKEGPGGWRILNVDDLKVQMDDQLWPPYSTANYGGDTFRVRIGSPDKTVTGIHRFTLSYTVKGAVVERDGVVQWRWNLRRNDQTPADKVTVVVHAPESPTTTQCWRVLTDGIDRSCGTPAGNPTQFEASKLAAGEDLNLWADYPVSAFDHPTPVLQEKLSRLGSSFSTTGVPNVVGGASEVVAWPLAALAALWAASRAITSLRRPRPQQFAGLAPGVIPDDPAHAPLEPVSRRVIPVRFDPPHLDGEDVPPALAGALANKGDVSSDVGAASVLIDLVVRGKAEITQSRSASDDEEWDWDQAPPLFSIRPDATPVDLDEFSALALATLRGKKDSYGPSPTDDLPRFGKTVKKLTELTERSLRPLVTRRPLLKLGSHGGKLTVAAIIAGILTLTMGVFTGFTGYLAAPAWWPRWGAVALLVVVLALVTLLVLSWISPRTPEPLGRALMEQSIGFRDYIATAEADKLRFEEAEARFTRYLPYATAYGLADRWVSEFGAPVLEHWRSTGSTPTWVGGDISALSSWASLGRFESYIEPSSAGGGDSGSGGSSWSSSSDSGSSSSSSSSDSSFGSSTGSW